MWERAADLMPVVLGGVFFWGCRRCGRLWVSAIASEEDAVGIGNRKLRGQLRAMVIWVFS